MSTRRLATHLRWVRVLGHDVRVAVSPGTEDRLPLLLCNGIGASLELLEPFVDALDPALTVIRFDVPGVGSSPAPRLPYNFAGLAWFVTKLLDQLGHDQVDVLGISWGGGLAQQIAFQHPKRCRRLILVSTATGMIMIPARPAVLAKMITPRRYRDATFAMRIGAQLYGGRLRDEPELAGRLLHEQSRIGSRRGYLYQLGAGLGWSSVPGLPFIRQSTLILSGTDDPIIPTANARLMRALIPRSSLQLFDDGHLGLVTQAELLAPRVSEFLSAAVE